MNSCGVPLGDFMVESFTLQEFEDIVAHDKDDLLCNIISNRYTDGSRLEVIKYEIIKENIYFFLRWYNE